MNIKTKNETKSADLSCHNPASIPPGKRGVYKLPAVLKWLLSKETDLREEMEAQIWCHQIWGIWIIIYTYIIDDDNNDNDNENNNNDDHDDDDDEILVFLAGYFQCLPAHQAKLLRRADEDRSAIEDGGEAGGWLQS